MRQVYVAQIECSPKIREKINSLHGVTLDEVKEAVLFPARPLRTRWIEPSEEDPRGPRLAVESLTLLGRRIAVVLYPVDEADGTWRLATAVPMV